MPVKNSSEKQLYISMLNAFGTIDAFIIPAGNPDIWEKYEEVKAYLKAMYKIERITDYIFTDERRSNYIGPQIPYEPEW